MCSHTIQWNPSCEATPFAPEKWPFKRGGLSSGWPLKRGSTVHVHTFFSKVFVYN